MLSLYNLSIKLYYTAIRLAAFRSKKAVAWLEGRRDVFSHLQKNIRPDDRIVWVHCSSAGEFEQGKPVIEAIKKTYPQKKILVTFFSPSGYNVALNYPFADIKTYLPLDTRSNAMRFYKLVKPELAVFVKYEFWFHHLSVAAFHHVPLLLVSAVFRDKQVFFRPYGRFFRQMLFFFRHIFVQDSTSLRLLQANGINHCSIGGDTRFDRVAQITRSPVPVPFIDEFANQQNVLVAGSTWPGDEGMLAAFMESTTDVKLIIAPHETNKAHLKNLQHVFPDLLFYSDLLAAQKKGVEDGEKQAAAITQLKKKKVLVIDSVGLLSRLYRHAAITYVGGGFTKDGIHNTLEAAVWGKPVLFGPNYQKYREAGELTQKGAAFCIQNSQELKQLTHALLQNKSYLQEAGSKAKAFIAENTGATDRVMQVIQEKRLLTN